jgi:hypothetical protein
MKAVVLLCAFACALVSTHTAAIGPTIGGPTVGLWYNPQESGRGFNVDIQGDTMIVTTFIYEPGGDPIWYLSSGTYDHRTGVFRSTYDSYANGQCFGCSPGSPVAQVGAGGQISITFHNDQSATLTYPGGSTNLIKFNYGFASPVDNLYGEWAFSFDIAGLIGGDWIIFSDPFVDSNGTIYAAGNMDGAPQYLAIGTYDTTLNAYTILIEVESYQDFFVIGLDDRRGFGNAWVLASGESPTGNGSAAAAGRLLYKSELTRSVEGARSTRQIDRHTFVDAGKSTTAATPEVVDALETLRRGLAAKRAMLLSP